MFGRVVYRGVEFEACCTKPRYADAYVFCKLFPAAVCKNCGEVILLCGPIKDFIFRWFFQPFWNGRVLVVKSQVTPEEMTRIREFNK